MAKLDLRILLVSVALSAVAAACSGGTINPTSSGNSINEPGGFLPSATSLRDARRQREEIPFDKTGKAIALPSTAGMAERIMIPTNNAPPGARLEVTVSRKLPQLVSRVPAQASQPFMSFTLKSSATVTLHGIPEFSVRLLSQPVSHGAFYAWAYNAQEGWRDFGPVAVSGKLLTFGGSKKNLKLQADVTYAVIPFTAPKGAVPPAGPQSTCAPPPTAGPGPTPAGTKLYVLDEEYPNGVFE